MKNIIKAVLLFLVPILKGAFIKAAADELTKLAYPTRQPIRRQPNYAAFGERPRTMADVDRLERDRIARVRSEKKYHDVLMLAVDITGPNSQIVHEFIHNYAPPAEETTTFKGHQISVDSCWIADDLSESDCDSAVFVHKGKQEEARELLRNAGLLN